MAKQVVEACVNAGTCAAGASHYAALISALASIWSQVKHQLIATMNNDLIGGSVALAVASTLVGLAWRLWRWIRGVAHDRMFVSYEIPSGTPQYFAALRWVYDQPAVRRASRRLVVNPIGTPLAAADGADSHAPSSAPDDPEDPLELGYSSRLFAAFITANSSRTRDVEYHLLELRLGDVAVPIAVENREGGHHTRPVTRLQ